MSKHLQLNIAEPCHENWDNMTTVQKGKFCGSCQKQVIDFSNMSDREVAQFFKKPTLSLSKGGSVCGRFMQDQLDRSIEIPRKRIPWVRYFFQFALPAFLMSTKATAQGKVKVTTASSMEQRTNCTTTVGMILPTIKKEQITDTLITPVQKMKREDLPAVQGEISAQLKPETKNNLEDTITLPGVIIVSYGQIKGKVSVSSVTQIAPDSLPVAPLPDELTGIMGGISVCRAQRIKVSKDSIVKRILKNIVPDRFKVFPNPANAGTSIHIEWKRNETGDFMLQLLNLSGQLTFSKEIWIDEEARLLEVQLPSVVAGNYFLRMTNKQSGKSFTEKIIIQ